MVTEGCCTQIILTNDIIKTAVWDNSVSQKTCNLQHTWASRVKNNNNSKYLKRIKQNTKNITTN